MFFITADHSAIRLVDTMMCLSSASVLFVAILVASPLLSTARPAYVQLIPSGSSVQGVVALGHQNPSGGGAVNAFGQAFQANNFQWTTALCRADSDGDGATNGEELSDPCCTWQPGGATSAQAAATHPGVANTFSASDLAAMRCLTSGTAAATTGNETQPSANTAGGPAATEPATVAGPGTGETAPPPSVASGGSGFMSAEPPASPMPVAPSPTKAESDTASDKPTATRSAASEAALATAVCVFSAVALMTL